MLLQFTGHKRYNASFSLQQGLLMRFPPDYNMTNKRNAEITILGLILVFIIALFFVQRRCLKKKLYLTRIAHTVLDSDEKHLNA